MALPLLLLQLTIFVTNVLSTMPITAWHIVYGKPQKEELAQFHLKLKGGANLFPAPLAAEVFTETKTHRFPLSQLSFCEHYSRARVLPGPLDTGVKAMLLEAPDGKGRVKVLMKMLSRDIKVELPVHWVADTWVPRGSHRDPLSPNEQGKL